MNQLRRIALPTLCVGSLLAAGCNASGEHDDDDDGQEETIALDQLPVGVREAATGAVPGLVIAEAEKELEDGETVYCVHGTSEGVFYEVEVSPDGRVLEIEKGDENGDGDDDEDDDDDEGHATD